jgi:hypothetical protein
LIVKLWKRCGGQGPRAGTQTSVCPQADTWALA